MKFFIATTLAVLLVTAAGAGITSATPLDDYVNKPDPAFKWSYTNYSFDGLDYMAYVYDLTSQTWMTPAYSSRYVWQHELVIVVPNKLNPALSDNAFVYLTGGSEHFNPHSIKPTDEGVFATAAVCVELGIIGATVRQIPAEPIRFTNDPWHKGGRSEDSAIALTWWQYMQDPSVPDVVLELPMTKAGVQALTAVQQIGPQYQGGKPIKSFGVSGASKRGWTSWLVAAVDKRVKLVIPLVLDAINTHKFLHVQWQQLGAWSFALAPYYDANITLLVDTPNFAKMMTFIDPFAYRARLTMPKLIVASCGDEFQNPGFFTTTIGHSLPGMTQLLMVKNAEHSLATGIVEVLTSITAFAAGMLDGGSPNDVPTYTWSVSETDGTISVTTSVKPTRIDVSYTDSALGVSAGRRDFRWAAIGVTPCPIEIFGACLRPLLWWTPKTNYITKISDTSYTALMPLPPKGQWRAFIVELRFADQYNRDKFYFTSPISVIPNTLPFPDCHGAGCKGTLC